MTRDQEVRALLDALAEDAPAGDELSGTHELIPRIRRRRRLRAIVPVCAAAAAGGLAIGLYSALPWQGGGAEPPAGPAAPAAPPGTCGGPVRADPAPGPLRAELRQLPADAAAGTLMPATLTLTNTAAAPVRGYTSAAPQLLLARDGVIVAAQAGARDVAVQVDLAPGARLDVPVAVALARCEPPGAAPAGAAGKTPVPAPAGTPLPAGSYAAYVAVTVQQVDAAGAPGAAIEVWAGPWPLRVR